MSGEESGGGVAFGSTLDRKLFPLHVPPNRSGNEHRLKGEPHLAPGSYDNHEVSLSVDRIMRIGSALLCLANVTTYAFFLLCN